MPLYEYNCETCGLEIEVLQKVSDPILETREECRGRRCKLSKKLSYFAGHIVGKVQVPIVEKEISRETTFSPAPPENDPVHICSKYCSHHTKNGA
jgi:putative FmdB family regulatory protein